MKIKVFEAFAGYGSQMMALRRVARRHAGGADFQLVGWSEIDDDAIARLIYLMMLKDKGLGHSLYAFTCLYAHKHITAEERDEINAVISADAEASKKSKGGEE